MALPVGFLLGLLVVFGCRELGATLPGSATVGGLLPFVALLMLPALLAAAARRSLLLALVRGRCAAIPPRSLLTLSVVATPATVLALYLFGAYDDWIDDVAWQSHLARTLLAVLPVYVAELPRIAQATATQALLEIAAERGGAQPLPQALLPARADVMPLARLRFGWLLVALMPLVLLGSLLDLLQLDRSLYVLCLGTSAGTTLGAIAFLLLAALLLPFWFRVAFGLVGRLPEPIGTALRHTASQLGFAPQRVMMLPTGMRTLNAMLVGPLPFGRCLCLTDGLLAAIDIEAARGVLAHEIGHARLGHPGILMVLAMLVPLLVLAPLRQIDLDALDLGIQALVLVVFGATMWFAVSRLARRFEHEADIASVRYLGAEPCSRALLAVSRLVQPAAHGLLGRLSSLHPDELQRVAVMRRYEWEAPFRAQFDRGSRRLRVGIAALATAAGVAAGWAWLVDWPYERALAAFHRGDHVAARDYSAAAGEVPVRWRKAWREFDAELAAALELAPDSRDWATASAVFETAGWQRGVRELLAAGPAAARPWLTLALRAMPRPSAVQRALHGFCAAAAAGDPERMAQLTSIVIRLGVPPGLEPVFRDHH